MCISVCVCVGGGSGDKEHEWKKGAVTSVSETDQQMAARRSDLFRKTHKTGNEIVAMVKLGQYC